MFLNYGRCLDLLFKTSIQYYVALVHNHVNYEITEVLTKRMESVCRTNYYCGIESR